MAKVKFLDGILTPNIQLSGGSGNQGLLTWNTDEETLDLVMNGSTLQVGQESVYHVTNQSGASIPDGTAVMATGTLGASGKITIAPIVADGSVPAKFFLGVTTETIADGSEGVVTHFGKVRGIDTSSYNEGDVLWLDPAVNGGFTTTMPSAPNLKIAAGFVINSHANNGTLFVRANQGTSLEYADDAEIASPATGQLLRYTGTRWENWTPNFLTSYTETDPIFTASAAYGIASGDITNWNTAFGWGNHAAAGYLTSFTETDPIFSASAASGIASGDITNWNTAHGWGDHAAAGYLTSYTETDTLASVVSRGNSTSTTISVGGIASGGIISGSSLRSGSGSGIYSNIYVAGYNTYIDNTATIWNLPNFQATRTYIINKTNVFNNITTYYPYFQNGELYTAALRDMNNSSYYVIPSNAFISAAFNGSVGIGTTSPTQKLEVNGNIRLGSNDAALIFNTSASSGDPMLKVESNGGFSFKNTAGTTNVFIDNGGAVGIGTTTPSSHLEIKGSGNGSVNDHVRITSTDTEAKLAFVTTDGNSAISSASDHLRFFTNTANTERMRLNSGGGLSIGVTGAQQLLDVNGSIMVRAANQATESGIFFRENFSAPSNAYNCSILAIDHNGSFPDGLSINGYDGISFSTGSNTRNEVMRITGGASNVGRVGIGTTSPSAELHVIGDGIFGDVRVGAISGQGVGLQDPLDSIIAYDAASFWTRIAGGALSLNPMTGEFQFNGTDVHWGSVANNFFSRKATLGVTESGLSEGGNGHRPEAGFGEGLYYKNPNAPFGGAGYPDFCTSSDFGGFIVNGNVVGYEASSGAANFSSTNGFGDVARFDGNFEYTYGMGSIMANPATAIFEAFGWAGSSKMQLDVFGANTLFAPSFTPTSDRKLKENIVPVSNGLDIVCGLQGVEYDLKINGKASSGFIAQDVEEIVPHAVVEKDEILRLNYNSLAAYHNEAIKELKGMIDELKSEIQQLKNK